MTWRTHPTSMVFLPVRILWSGIVGAFLILSLLGGETWAQGTVYSWTDEKGVVHFSGVSHLFYPTSAVPKVNDGLSSRDT